MSVNDRFSRALLILPLLALMALLLASIVRSDGAVITDRGSHTPDLALACDSGTEQKADAQPDASALPAADEPISRAVAVRWFSSCLQAAFRAATIYLLPPARASPGTVA